MKIRILFIILIVSYNCMYAVNGEVAAVTVHYTNEQGETETLLVPKSTITQSRVWSSLLQFPSGKETIIELNEKTMPVFSQEQIKLVLELLKLQSYNRNDEIVRTLQPLSKEVLIDLMVNLDYIDGGKALDAVKKQFVALLLQPQELTEILKDPTHYFSKLELPEHLQESLIGYITLNQSQLFQLIRIPSKSISFNAIVSSVQWNNTGIKLAMSSFDEKLRILNMETNRLRSFDITSTSNSVSWSPSSLFVALATLDKKIILWNVAQEKEEKILTGHQGNVTTVQWHPQNNALLASGSWDKTVRFFNVTTNEEVQVITEQNPVFSLDWSPDGNTLVVAAGTEINLYNKNGTLIKKFSGQQGRINIVRFNPQGTHIIAGSEFGQVYLFDIQGVLVHTLPENQSSVRGLAWSPDGILFAYGKADGSLGIFNFRRNYLRKIPNQEPIFSIGWGNTNKLVLGTQDGMRIFVTDGLIKVTNPSKKLNLFQALILYAYSKEIPISQYPQAQAILDTILGTK